MPVPAFPDNARRPLRDPAADAPQRPYLLIVDDEKSFADALRFRLEARGVPCRTAYCGQEALRFMDAPELEVVLLDVNMPGLHGLEALRRIKTLRPDVEVVLLTGEADFSVAAKGMRRGAGDYLLKPVDFDALWESISKARTRSREHRERLRAAEAGKLMALGALAAGVGHEINNPLQIILQRSEWLQELIEDARNGAPDFAELAKTARILQEQAARAGSITAQLLDLARNTRSGTAETNLPELAAKVCERCSERAASLGAALHLDLAGALPNIPCSPAELEPVLAHLLKNALDAIEAAIAKQEDNPDTPDAGRIRAHTVRLHAEQSETGIRISVADTGEGVAPEHAPHIFEPFFSTRPVGKGAGLGLTLCHSIITALRGEVRFAPALPAGTLFSVDIPLGQEDATDFPEHTPETEEEPS